MTTTQATTQARRRARSWPSGWFGVVTWLLSGLLLAFIVLPIVRLVTTSSVALATIHHLLTHYATDAEVRRLVDETTVYVIPRIAVDGSELFLTTPATVRSTPPSPRRSAPVSKHRTSTATA